MTEIEPLDEIDAYVGRRIGVLRLAADLSEEEFALQLGLAPLVLRAIEEGRDKVFCDTLVNAARVLSVSVAELLPPLARQPVPTTTISNP